MADAKLNALRADLARRVALHGLVLGAAPVAVCWWQMRQAGLMSRMSAAAGAVTLVLWAIAAFGEVRPRARTALVLGGLAVVPMVSAALGGLLPGLAGGVAMVWLLAAFLVGPRAALAVGFAIEVGLLSVGALHRLHPSLIDGVVLFTDVTDWRNWGRTALTLLALTAVGVPGIVGHLRALAEATTRSRELLAAAGAEERKRAAANAARTSADAERRENAGLNVLDMIGAGVAHRCGNLLQVVANEIDELRAASTSADRASVRDRLADMAEAVSGSAAVLRRLLAMNEGGAPATESIDLAEFALAARSQLAPVRGIEIVTSVGQGPRVLADPSSLHGVVLNLALNARDAMPHGGRVTITARPATQAEAAATGCSAALDVADTGSGMDRATLSRVFEPFFTTKGSSGTGIGLHAARRALEAAGGHIRVESEPGRGTTFTLLLPPAPEAPSHTRQVVPQITSAGRGVPILVVDDNADARRGWTSALQQRGFVVHEADDVDAALGVVRSHPLALAWVDAAMPGRPARELLDELRRAQPWVQLVVCSVLGAEELARRGLVASDVERVGKPCSLSVLLDHADRAAVRYGRAS